MKDGFNTSGTNCLCSTSCNVDCLSDLLLSSTLLLQVDWNAVQRATGSAVATGSADATGSVVAILGT